MAPLQTTSKAAPAQKTPEEQGKERTEEKEKEGKDGDEEDLEAPPIDKMPNNDLRQGGITVRSEEGEEEKSERDLYGTQGKSQHELRGISYASINELRHGMWAAGETADIQNLRQAERFRPMDVTVYDIKRLQNGE